MPNVLKMKIYYDNKVKDDLKKVMRGRGVADDDDDDSADEQAELSDQVEPGQVVEKKDGKDNKDNVKTENLKNEGPDISLPSTSSNAELAADNSLKAKIAKKAAALNNFSSIPMMVEAAIKELNGQNGSSAIAINEYITQKYVVKSSKLLKAQIKKCISEGIASGRLEQVKRSYKLSSQALKDDQRKDMLMVKKREKKENAKDETTDKKEEKEENKVAVKPRVTGKIRIARAVAVVNKMPEEHAAENKNSPGGSQVKAAPSDTTATSSTKANDSKIVEKTAENLKEAKVETKAAAAAAAETVDSTKQAQVAVEPTQKLAKKALKAKVIVQRANARGRAAAAAAAEETKKTSEKQVTAVLMIADPSKKRLKRTADKATQNPAELPTTSTPEIRETPIEIDEKEKSKKVTRSQSKTNGGGETLNVADDKAVSTAKSTKRTRKN